VERALLVDTVADLVAAGPDRKRTSSR